MHLTLLFGRLSWRSRAVLSLGAAIVLTLVTLVMSVAESGGTSASDVCKRLEIAVSLYRPPPYLTPLRPFNLFRANLSDQWLVDMDLRNAYLHLANLARATFRSSDLTGAWLMGAHLLIGTSFFDVNL